MELKRITEVDREKGEEAEVEVEEVVDATTYIITTTIITIV